MRTTKRSIIRWQSEVLRDRRLGALDHLRQHVIFFNHHTRASIFREGGTISGGPVPGGVASTPQDLSVTKGARRYWSPNNGELIGDYMRGAFAYDGKLRFIAQWPERNTGNPLRIRYNVITVQP